MNGSVTSKVIGLICCSRRAFGSGLFSQSRIVPWNAKATPEGNGEREQADDEPCTQLAEMLDEGRLLPVLEAPRQQARMALDRVELALAVLAGP